LSTILFVLLTTTGILWRKCPSHCNY